MRRHQFSSGTYWDNHQDAKSFSGAIFADERVCRTGHSGVRPGYFLRPKHCVAIHPTISEHGFSNCGHESIHYLSHGATLKCFGNDLTREDQTFTTGALPPTPFPTLSVSRPPSTSSESDGIELLNIFAPGANTLQGFIPTEMEIRSGTTM